MPARGSRSISRPRFHVSRQAAIGFMLLNTVVWGAALPLVKPGLEVTTAFLFLFERFLLAGILTLPLMIWYFYKQPKLRRSIPIIVALEILGTTVALALLYSGLERTSSLEASLITMTTPIFTTIGGILFLREKEERMEWIGLTLATVGTLLLVIEPIFRGAWQQTEFSFFGNVLVFLQNIVVAAYFLMAKRWYAKLPKLFVVSLSFWVGVISFGIMSWLELGSSWVTMSNALQRDLLSPAVWVAVGYMATFGSIIGLTAYIKGQDGMEASEASLYTYLQPLVSLPLAWIMLREQTTPLILFALAIIFSGVAVAEYRWKKTSRKQAKKTPRD
jgi:drug/metabolite transporter (DMT)-like permease